MTKDQRVIAAGIDFIARCQAAGLAMQGEYHELFDRHVQEDCSDEAVQAWEAGFDALTSFVSDCESTLMRATLLACGRANKMLKTTEDVDVASIQAMGGCSIRTQDMVITVGVRPGDDEPCMAMTSVANHVEDATAAGKLEPSEN